MKEQPSSQQRVWVCGRRAGAQRRHWFMTPSTYPRPTSGMKGGILTAAQRPMTKS